MTSTVLTVEQLKYGFTPFLSSPSGCHPPLSYKRLRRNPYSRYHPYHSSCPELVDLLEWCTPVGQPPEMDVDGELIGEAAVYEGWVPWRVGGDVSWGREKG